MGVPGWDTKPTLRHSGTVIPRIERAREHRAPADDETPAAKPTEEPAETTNVDDMDEQDRNLDRDGGTAIPAVLVTLYPAMLAQSTTQGAISGTVFDSTGAAIGKATITIRNNATNAEQVATADESGNFIRRWLNRKCAYGDDCVPRIRHGNRK